MTQYSAKDVRVLEEVEHIRLNPGMYVGDTTNPVHLIEEALDNALDEALAGHAKIIAVFIDTKKNEFSVLDNGRGIPISDDTPVTVSSKLFSGAKFQDKKSAYQISSGLHGVGLVAVNALSKEYIVEIFRNNKYAKYHFKNTKLWKKDINKSTQKTPPFSTKIQFIPDKKFFETLTPNLDRIRRRLSTAAAELSNENIKFILTVDDKTEIFKLSAEDYFRSLLTTKTHEFSILASKGPEKYEIIFAYEDKGSVTPKLMSSINLLPVDGGGTHVNMLYDIFKDFFHAKAKKYGYSFQPNDCLVGLRAYLMLSLIEPKFSGQTKDKLTNRKSYFDKFIPQFKNQLEEIAKYNEDVIKEFLERFQDYRRKLDAKKLIRNGSTSNRASTKFTKLRDCSSRLGELFIVEGDSAGGSIIQSRDPRKHAVLPLKGKSIPNVTTKKNILENKEVGELIKAIGTGVGPHFNLSKLRYSKIVCATDADHDGAHIACLVTMAMAILLPDVIKAGKYFIASTPLFAINEKKFFKPLWNEKELEKARKENRNIQRYKGLGEMNPRELKISLLDDSTRNLTPITYSDNIDYLIKLFSSAEEKRKLVS
ncbi:MAG: toprim domain-containing protein [Candidatus Heimdallarchaeaceae archaeon]